MNVLSLFAGIGGFDVGLSRAGFRTAAFCEIDEKARAVLTMHWPGVPIYEDVAELTGDRLRSDGIVPDCIVGGFPCQDISLAGRMAGIEGAKSGLWEEYRRLVEEISPSFVIVENSPVLRSRGLEAMLWQLDALGYDAEWHCVPANAIGAPHRRDRLWIVAYPTGFGDGLPERQVCTGRDFAQHDPWWATTPQVSRVDDGVPDRLDRHPQLGNAVVPQIVERIGRAIQRAVAVNERLAA